MIFKSFFLLSDLVLLFIFVFLKKKPIIGIDNLLISPFLKQEIKSLFFFFSFSSFFFYPRLNIYFSPHFFN